MLLLLQEKNVELVEAITAILCSSKEIKLGTQQAIHMCLIVVVKYFNCCCIGSNSISGNDSCSDTSMVVVSWVGILNFGSRA